MDTLAGQQQSAIFSPEMPLILDKAGPHFIHLWRVRNWCRFLHSFWWLHCHLAQQKHMLASLLLLSLRSDPSHAQPCACTTHCATLSPPACGSCPPLPLQAQEPALHAARGWESSSVWVLNRQGTRSSDELGPRAWFLCTCFLSSGDNYLFVGFEGQINVT